MAALKIVWSETAVQSLHQMILFYNTRNGSMTYSRSVYQRIKETLALIAIHPYVYKATSFADIRVFQCDHFKLFYQVTLAKIRKHSLSDLLDKKLLKGKR